MITTAATEHGLAARPPQASGANGAVRTSKYYYLNGKRKRATTEVPIDQYGAITGVQFACKKCKTIRWVAAAVASKGVPICEIDDRRMFEKPVKNASLIPWDAIKMIARGPQVRAVWALAAVAAAGTGLAGGHVPPAGVAAAGLPVALVATVWSHKKLVPAARARRHLVEASSPERSRIARSIFFFALIAVLWLTLAAATGTDPHTFAGRVTLTILAPLWLLPAAIWWRWLRRIGAARAALLATPPPEPEPEPEPEPDDAEVPMDPDEAYVRDRWSKIVAVRKDAVIGTAPDGSAIKAEAAGRLVGTWLEDWHKVEGGWAATIVGPDGKYTADNYLNIGGGPIASAFKMKKSMVTVIPDDEDENRALVLAQRKSPIAVEAGWAGPDSIDVERGIAPVAPYIDGTLAYYEIFRPDWGSPHVAVFGTTGSGKSEFLNLLFAIDRWASYVDAEGVRHGLVASFLIDPQQGQSYAPFIDALAGPVATSLEEAKILVRAFTAEMLRRNRYLTREAQTWDPKRKKMRKGRKWWNPVLDGPILTLTIDEAHDYLADREFCTLLTKGGRMWRKCGGQVRLGTHTPLLADLGGSMALRDMLVGGFVAVFRTANKLTGTTAFNGRLPVDPSSIPPIPGMCYLLTGVQPKPMLARAMFEKDWYDYVADLDDNPIGYPGVLPSVTLQTFGAEYAQWVRHAASDNGEPFSAAAQTAAAAPVAAPTVCVDAVRLALAHGGECTGGQMTTTDIMALLLERGISYSLRTVREAIDQLRKAGEAETTGTGANKRHALTASALVAVLDELPGADGLGDAA